MAAIFQMKASEATEVSAESLKQPGEDILADLKYVFKALCAWVDCSSLTGLETYNTILKALKAIGLNHLPFRLSWLRIVATTFELGLECHYNSHLQKPK
jgi:hypothetical protein